MRPPRSALLLLAALAASPAAAETTLRVMSFNIWGGGQNEGKGIEETLAAIRASGADVVGVQEVRTEGETCTAESCPPLGKTVGPALAEALGWHYREAGEPSAANWANAVLSRFPIAEATADGLGVRLDVEGREVWLFNVHFDDEPYQPYQIMGIEYGPAPFVTTAAEAEDWARRTRGPALDMLESSLAAAEGAELVLLTGDFNEPSHLDWTEAAVEAGQKPLAVAWPTTTRVESWGFVDAFRAAHPDPVAKPAFTWTSRYPEEATDDYPDRIDFVFVRGGTVTEAWIVGEDGPRSDKVVEPWPSDHRAAMAEVRF